MNNLCPKCYLLRYFFSDNSVNKEKLTEINLDFKPFLVIELYQQRDTSGNVVDGYNRHLHTVEVVGSNPIAPIRQLVLIERIGCLLLFLVFCKCVSGYAKEYATVILNIEVVNISAFSHAIFFTTLYPTPRSLQTSQLSVL
jgi:hypothetical protein